MPFQLSISHYVSCIKGIAKNTKYQILNTKYHKAPGVTLIELIVVIAILAILITLGTYSFEGVQKRSRDSRRKDELKAIKTALVLYYQDYRRYPPDPAVYPNTTYSSNTQEKWVPQLEDYIQKLPKDPRQASLSFLLAIENSLKQFFAQSTSIQPVYAASSSTNSPGTVVNSVIGESGCTSGARNWTNPGNATASDNLYATSTMVGFNDATNCLKATNFGFVIPANATINGILVQVERSGTGFASVRDASIKLVKNGIIAGNDNIVRATGLDWPVTDTNTYASYGGAADLWGLSWTPADINAANFGVVYAGWNVSTGTGPANVDHIRMTVYYTVPTPTPTPTPTPSPSPTPAPPPPAPPPPAPSGDCTRDFVYCYIVASDRSLFVLWAQLENTNDREIYSNIGASCKETPPTGSHLNYCITNPN